MNRVRSNRFFRPTWSGLVVLVVGCGSGVALAAGGQPLVLDTTTGISDGQGGTVLQTAPFSREPMVQAKTLPSPGGQQNPAPPIIVSPYIQLPGPSGATAPAAQHGQAARMEQPTPTTEQSGQ